MDMITLQLNHIWRYNNEKRNRKLEKNVNDIKKHLNDQGGLINNYIFIN
jgi:hypothetical protein